MSITKLDEFISFKEEGTNLNAIYTISSLDEFNFEILEIYPKDILDLKINIF